MSLFKKAKATLEELHADAVRIEFSAVGVFHKIVDDLEAARLRYQHVADEAGNKAAELEQLAREATASAASVSKQAAAVGALLAK